MGHLKFRLRSHWKSTHPSSWLSLAPPSWANITAIHVPSEEAVLPGHLEHIGTLMVTDRQPKLELQPQVLPWSNGLMASEEWQHLSIGPNSVKRMLQDDLRHKKTHNVYRRQTDWPSWRPSGKKRGEVMATEVALKTDSGPVSSAAHSEMNRNSTWVAYLSNFPNRKCYSGILTTTTFLYKRYLPKMVPGRGYLLKNNLQEVSSSYK